MLVDLGADDEIHRVAAAMLEKQFLQPDVVEIVDAALQLSDLLGNGGQHRDVVSDRLHQRQRATDQVGALDQQRPDLAHRRLEHADLEQHHRLRGLLHLIDRVVHRRDQVLDVAAVERGDEGAADRGQHLAGDAVGVIFELVDALAEHRGFVAAAQHVLQAPAPPARPSGHAGQTGRKTAPPWAKRHETSAQHGSQSIVLDGRGRPVTKLS